MQTKEQKRSAFALNKVEDTFGIPVKKDAANFVVGVPTMVLANGLGQTLAFLLSKQKKNGSKDHYRITFTILQEWLNNELPELQSNSEIEFLQKFAELDQRKYLKAQQESLALLQWLKRYVRAFQQEEEEQR